MAFPSPTTYRPPITGRQHMVASGHYLATMAGLRILEQGGNAIDAGVAAGLCINVLKPDMTNIGGVAPIMLYSARERKVFSISGLGTWPAATDREYFINDCDSTIPPGVRRCVLPAAMDSWLTALERWGSKSFAEVAAPAIELAAEGFGIYPFLQASLADAAQQLAGWDSSAAIYLPNGGVPQVGERFVQGDLANTLNMLCEAENGASSGSREAGIQAARERFYAGDIAERIADFMQAEDGWMAAEDLTGFRVEIEEPPSVDYRGYQVYGCGPWCQGPVALQTLKILEGYDLASFNHNSPESLHLILEALKAAFADREKYYGDPNFIDVPLDGLLHPDYAAEWRNRISDRTASPGMPEPGDPWSFSGLNQPESDNYRHPDALEAPVEPDTSYLCIVDADGNAFSATPSDGVTGTPIIPGLGFIVSGRGVQSWLDPDHPSAIAPGKRPRLTPNPGLIMKAGSVFAPYGTPGNDTQPQAMVQFVVNLIDQGLNPQEAVEAPRVATYSFPRSTHPHPYSPGLTQAETRISQTTLEALVRRGHRIERWPDLAAPAGSVCTIVVDAEHGTLTGAADPRRLAYAMGW